jgi:predicted nucleic acid-binding protein
VSGDVYAEYDEVIRRPRFRRSSDEIEAALRAVRERGFWVKPTGKVLACSDPDDDVFLECAQAAGADYLFTGNVKHFPSAWAGTKIVTPRQFLDGWV